MMTAQRARPLSVLIVDDDPVFSALAEAVLLDAGCANVEIAEAGESGVRSALSVAARHDMVLLDLNMPGFDGLAAMRHLAGIDFAGSVALVSGEKPAVLQASAGLARLHGLRLSGILSKPLRADELISALAASAQGKGRAKPRLAHATTGGLDKVARLVPVYQPKVRLADKSIYGAEALMRVILKDGRVAPPVNYLAKATKAGSLGEATLSFLDTILDDARSWRGTHSHRPISINIPAPLLEKDGYMDRFVQIVRERGLKSSQITVEMTEAALPKNMSKMVEIMTRLRMAGFGLAIDDYGTGMANYDILRQCPFTELKLDRSVVQAATHDDLACGFIGNCVSISRALSMTIVAEGVETAEQTDAMLRLGIDVIQGYFFSRPLSQAEYAAVLMSPGTGAQVSSYVKL
jgi:EAL domain-containing protein (putative c-di-GMP-specific phosphodiesterase class I)